MTTRDFGNQNNIAKRDLVDDVSDPDSPDYDPSDPNFDAQWNSRKRGEKRSADDQPSGEFDPNVVVKTQDPTLAALKPADSTSKVVAPNSYKNTQEG
jgi:hypothetical protein